MPKLKVTIPEARNIFYNLQQDLRKLCEEEYNELKGSGSVENDEFESLWSVVDREFRLVYEMSRYSLQVPELGDSLDDVDVFRGYCEDVDGVEPRDKTIVRNISKVTQEIQLLLETNASYRSSIPATIEKSFNEHVAAKRGQFNALLSGDAVKNRSRPSNSEYPPTDLLQTVMSDVTTRLRQADLLLSLAHDSKDSHFS